MKLRVTVLSHDMEGATVTDACERNGMGQQSLGRGHGSTQGVNIGRDK